MQVTSYCIVVFSVISYIEKINSATDLNEDGLLVFNCPQQFRQSIEQHVCPNPQIYHCLRVRNKKLQFLQTCKYSRTPVPKGEYPIQDKDSGNLNSEICPEDEFQFGPSWSNEQSKCLFRKSLCNEEGQIIYSHENSSRDRRCACDHTDGYKLTTHPRNRQYCIPFVEDCSCYRDIKQEDSYTTDIKIVSECLKYLNMLEEPTKCDQVVYSLYKRITKESQKITSTSEIPDGQTYEKQGNWNLRHLKTIVICIICFLVLTSVSLIWNSECTTSLWLIMRKMPCIEQDCSKNMPNKLDNKETPAEECHTVTINQQHVPSTNEPNAQLLVSNLASRMGARVVSTGSVMPICRTIQGTTYENSVKDESCNDITEQNVSTTIKTVPLKPTDENYVNRKKHSTGPSKSLSPRGLVPRGDSENDEKCLESNDLKDIHGAEHTSSISANRDIAVLSVECDNSVESYVQHLRSLNMKFKTNVTIKKFPENASIEQQVIILRTSRHIFIYITANFTIQKLKQLVNFEHLKERYFEDPINVERVKLVCDNTFNIPEELCGLNIIPYCTDGNSEIYNNRMQYYYSVVRKN